MKGGRKDPQMYIIRPGEKLPPEALHAFDQSQASVRDAYDKQVQKLVEIAQGCKCGEPITSATHILSFQATLAESSHHGLAALALEGLLRDALAKIAEQTTPEGLA